MSCGAYYACQKTLSSLLVILNILVYHCHRGTHQKTYSSNSTHFRTLLNYCNLVNNLDKQIETKRKRNKRKCEVDPYNLLQGLDEEEEEEDEDEEEDSAPTGTRKVCKSKNIWDQCLQEEEVPIRQPKKKKKKKKRKRPPQASLFDED